MTDLPTAEVISLGIKRRLRTIDCQGESKRSTTSGFCKRSPAPTERPFLVVRTKASTVIEGLRKGADEQRRECRARIQSDAMRDAKLGDPAQTAHWLRQVANEIETECGDAS